MNTLRKIVRTNMGARLQTRNSNKESQIRLKRTSGNNNCFDSAQSNARHHLRFKRSLNSGCQTPKFSTSKPEISGYNIAQEVVKQLRQAAQFLKDQSKITANHSIQKIDMLFRFAGTNRDQISRQLSSHAHVIQTKLKSWKSSNQNISFEQQQLTRGCSIFFHNLHQMFFSESKLKKAKEQDLVLHFLELDTNFYALNVYIDSIFDLQYDITFMPVSQFPSNLRKRTVYREMSTKSMIAFETKYAMLRKMYMILVSALIYENARAWKMRSEIWRKAVFGLSFPLSAIYMKQSEIVAYYYLRRPTYSHIRNLLELPEKGLIQHFPKAIYSFIKESFYIYLPDPAFYGASNIDIFSHSSHCKLKILILNHQKLQRKKYNSQSSTHSKNIEDVIIYIHGGGFISMNSGLMQTYTRKWANELHVPVICIEYSKAPLYKYPIPVDECQNAYKFVVDHLHRHLNIKPKNIVLCGDSAGGNLVCALMIRLMRNNFHLKPIGMLLIYPAVDLRNKFSISYLNGLVDGIISGPLLNFCKSQYLPDEGNPQNQSSYFQLQANPILLKQRDVQESNNLNNVRRVWPKTTFLVGEKDPLYDHSLKFFEYLTGEGVDTKLIVYQKLIHGFMHMDSIFSECKPTIKDSIAQLKVLLDQKGKNVSSL